VVLVGQYRSAWYLREIYVKFMSLCYTVAKMTYGRVNVTDVKKCNSMR